MLGLSCCNDSVAVTQVDGFLSVFNNRVHLYIPSAVKPMPQIQDCKRELRQMFLLNREIMPGYIEVNAGELHERVFGVSSSVTAICCAAMRSELHDGDTILCGALDDLTSGFTVRYIMPRPTPVVPGDSQD